MLKVIGRILYMVGKALGGTTGSGGEVAIKPCGTVDINTASSILLDKLEEMGDDGAEIYLPDVEIKVYRKEDVESCYEMEEVSGIKFIDEVMDCDDFAAELYGKFAGLVWSNLHALNCFISDGNIFYFIEPQTGKISQTLEGWQGSDIRFVLLR